MGLYIIKMPDIGEGVAEAELVELPVSVGDGVAEDAVLAAVMTDKATVEIPSPVDGTVAWIGANIGDTVAVGSALFKLEIEGEGNVSADQADALFAVTAEAEVVTAPAAEPEKTEPPKPVAPPSPVATPVEQAKPLASPAVRRRAKDAGVDLRCVLGSGPAGVIRHEDLDAYMAGGRQGTNATPARPLQDQITEVPIVGLRRKIAEKMAISASRIPHITYVEEIDVSKLEELRAELNQQHPDRSKLTLLPFLMRAMVRALSEQPNFNALYDDEAQILKQHSGVHMGIAAQTDKGLMVPVVRHTENRDLWDCANEMRRVTEAAKSGTAERETLSGSTITISSLGAMGGVVTTPIINHPEVAIVGVNKVVVRPVWDGQQFLPHKMMNLSASFDHRIIDGWDAAVFVQRIKSLLESPAQIFIEG